MALLAIGLHFLIAAFFAMHAVRAGHELYWARIVLMIPLLGSLCYLAAVLLPQSRVRQLRDANDAFELAPAGLKRIRPAAEPNFRSEEFGLLLAKAYEAAGSQAEAAPEYAAAA